MTEKIKTRQKIVAEPAPNPEIGIDIDDNAATNIVANYVSDKIFKSIRSKMSPETLKNIYSNQGRAIALSIFKEAGGESFEEFIQTYAEYAQNMNSNID